MSTTSELRVIPVQWLVHAGRAIKLAPRGLYRPGWNHGLPPRLQERFDIGAVATAIAFITAGPTCRISVPKTSSYWLKHRCEEWGDRVGYAPYVMNGDLIAALSYCNVRLGRPHGANCAVALRYEEGA